MDKYVCDFETTTAPTIEKEGFTRVWACGITSIDSNYDFYYSNNINYFFSFAMWHPGNYYFHNLKFDASFLLCELFKRGYRLKRDKRKLKKREFTTLISGDGKFYTTTICFPNGEKIDIIDSLKIFTMSVDEIGKSFGMDIEKLSIDYDEYRPPDHELTPHEIKYLKNDCEIVARALSLMFSKKAKLEGMEKEIELDFSGKITQGSMALMDYKRIIGTKSFKRWFPVPKYDSDIRQSYRGGFTYVNHLIVAREIGKGIVLDVNSLYPFVMYSKLLPYGEGKFFEGQYEPDDRYPLYIQMFKCNFELKENHIPTVQIKGKRSVFIENEYLHSDNGEEPTLCMTNIDFQLFLDHYDVDINDIEFISGWKFKGATGLFKEFIDKWNEVKIVAGKQGNDGLRLIAKLMLNALYGKFALNPKVKSKYPYMIDDTIFFKTEQEKDREPIYIPMGSFITSYAREITIRAAQKVFHRFLYADTDSLHLSGTELPKELKIDNFELGAWKLEGTFKRAKYIRQKCYLEEMYISEKEYLKAIEKGESKKQFYNEKGQWYKLCITAAGMPKSCYDNVTWDNFVVGSEFAGKLKPIQVKGGCQLIHEMFSIKPSKPVKISTIKKDKFKVSDHLKNE